MAISLPFPQRVWIGQHGSGLWLLPVCVYVALVPYGKPGIKGLPWFRVHSFNLLPHEAGHVFFGFFGELMMDAGGSLLQLLFPCFFLSTALRYDSSLGAQISLVWLG